jgi:hypothetical protein
MDDDSGGARERSCSERRRLLDHKVEHVVVEARRVGVDFDDLIARSSDLAARLREVRAKPGAPATVPERAPRDCSSRRSAA